MPITRHKRGSRRGGQFKTAAAPDVAASANDGLTITVTPDNIDFYEVESRRPGETHSQALARRVDGNGLAYADDYEVEERWNGCYRVTAYGGTYEVTTG